MSGNNSSRWSNETDLIPVSLPGSVLICTIVSSSLSIFGAVLIFVTYCIVTVAKNQTRRLLVYLTIADLLTAVGNLMGAVRYTLRDESEYINKRDQMAVNCTNTDQICVIQSSITTFSSLASFFWTNIIMVHILMTLISQREWSRFFIKVLYHLVSWGVPLVITFLAASMQALGEDFSISSGPWCWIKGCLKPGEVIFWMTFTGKGWEILTYFLTMTFYILMKFYMIKKKMRFKDRSQNHLREEDELYIMIFFVIVILRVVGTARYFMAVTKAIDDNLLHSFGQTDMVLLHIQSVGDSAQAFCNCILFCVRDTDVRRELWKRICACRLSPDERRPLVTEVNSEVN
ncbi:G-protein coupled receptor 157-like [Saccostrea cucullata]|uniref:G-protein coupled receptor 157-like n=1 Tax=Saccostrea cuccullata TaxID=36930 RepID=UPI002ED193A2